MVDRLHLIETALGKRPADLVMKDANIFSVYTGEFIRGDLAVTDGYIAGIGKYQGKQEYDCGGRYLVPGFINAHLHLESSMLSPAEFARAVVQNGTTTVVADPHEIANVAGINGIRYMMDATEHLPVRVYFMLPSCVPSTHLEHSGATLSSADLEVIKNHPRVLGLAEVMNVPGVLSQDPELKAKLDLFRDLKGRDLPGFRIDGHAPGLMGKELMAYAAAGIHSDHECITAEEAAVRLQAGIYVFIREGTAAQNLQQLLPVITPGTAPYCCFCTDDRHPADLMNLGDINYIIRKAVASGLPVGTAIQMATVNAARYFGLRELGSLCPGARADMVLYDNLQDWLPERVYQSGELVYDAAIGTPEKGDSGKQSVIRDVDSRRILHSVQLPEISEEEFAIPMRGKRAHVIGLIPHQIVTEHLQMEVSVEDGCAVADTEKDILKLAVFERHHATGYHANALVKGFGLKQGAIASTVGHDSHNLIIIGTNDRDMLAAAERIRQMGGGEVIVADGKVAGELPLPIAGLMSDLPVQEAADTIEMMRNRAYELGVNPDYDPFLTLAFLSLPVIPSLKLTDMGLVDVAGFRMISVEAADGEKGSSELFINKF